MGLPALEILPQPCGRTGQRGKKQDLGHESVFRSCFFAYFDLDVVRWRH